MNHRLIQPRAKNVTPILASTNLRVGWSVIAGFVAAMLILLAVAIAAGVVDPFFTATVLAGAR